MWQHGWQADENEHVAEKPQGGRGLHVCPETEIWNHRPSSFWWRTLTCSPFKSIKGVHGYLHLLSLAVVKVPRFLPSFVPVANISDTCPNIVLIPTYHAPVAPVQRIGTLVQVSLILWRSKITGHAP